MAQVVKNPPASAGDARDVGSIPGWGRCPGEDSLEKEIATHFSILVWRIPQTEDPGGLQSMVSQESDTTEFTCTSPISAWCCHMESFVIC